MTTTATTLEAKIQEMEVKMPGVSKMLQKKAFGLAPHYRTSWPTDVAYAETENYKVVAAKWTEHAWSKLGGGVQWNGFCEVYSRLKGSEGGFLIDDPIRTTIRDQYDAQKDKPELWGHTFVCIQHLEGDKVRVAWADKDGREGPAYEVKEFGNQRITYL